MTELRWRSARPKIALHPSALALLAGSRQDGSQFRSTRDDIVRAYRQFLDVSGHGYSGIGLAMPFVGP